MLQLWSMTHPGEVNGGAIKLKARYVLKLPVELHKTEKIRTSKQQKWSWVMGTNIFEVEFPKQSEKLFWVSSVFCDITVCI